MLNHLRRYEMARNAYSDIEIYRQIAGEHCLDVKNFDWMKNWEKVPVLSKDMIQGRIADLLDPRCILWENTPKMQSVFTSGTTGICLEILWLLEDVKSSLMPLWLRRWKLYGIRPQDQLCTFFSSRRYGQESKWYQLSGNELAFAKEALDEEHLLHIYEMMVENKVRWMILQPSILLILYRFMNRRNLPVWKELAYIEVTGEYMLQSFYQCAREWFRVPIVNQYGAYEVNTIAYGEGTGYLDVVESNVYVEIIDDTGCLVPDETDGNVCVTCLTNHAMPFVRYMIGDIGKMRDSPYTSNQRQICLTKARCADLIYTKNGREISPYVLQKAVEITNHIMDGAVIQFRFIQTTYSEILVELITTNEYSFEEICHCIRCNIFQKEFREINFLFEKKDFLLPDIKKEKWGWFVSNI